MMPAAWRTEGTGVAVTEQDDAEVLRRAARALEAGRPAEAWWLMEPLLADRAGDAGVLHLAAYAAHAAGQAGQAAVLIDRAVALAPDQAALHSTRGAVLAAEGRLEEAVAAHRRAVALAPTRAEAHLNLANALLRSGAWDEAAAEYRRTVGLAPAMLTAVFGLGMALRGGGYAEAAAAAFARAQVLAPEDGEIACQQGAAAVAAGRPAEAEGHFRRCLALMPDHAAALADLGRVLCDLGRPEEALPLFEQVVSLRPGDAAGHNNLGLALKDLGRLDAAAAAYRAALALDPRLVHAHNNLGIVRQAQGDAAGAAAGFQAALALDPGDARARTNLGLCRLQEGALAEGWADYAARWEGEAGRAQRRPFALPAWDGVPRRGLRLLVWGEQGVGDEILHAGLIPDLVAAGVSVTLECEPRLAPLFRRSFPEVRVAARRDPPDPRLARPGGVHCASGDLGRWLRPDMAAFPPHAGYLRADPARVAALRSALGGGRLVGLAWSSRQARNRRFKGLDLAALAPALARPGVTLVDLQYGDTTAERAALAAAGTHLRRVAEIDPLVDLDGFAALVAAMDAVVSVSNTTVHVAGGLGVPALALIPTGQGMPWYWFRGRADCPWYPAVRLLRQARPGDWAAPVAAAAAALDSLLTAPSPPP